MSRKGGAISSWMFVTVWMGVIFTFSSIPDLRSGFQPFWDLILRKLAHALEYAILGWLSFRAFERGGVRRTRAALWSVLLSVVYAGTDELHQTFVPGREGSVWDVAIDGFGAMIGSVIRARRT